MNNLEVEATVYYGNVAPKKMLEGLKKATNICSKKSFSKIKK
jgi:hypothetical protein